MAASATVAVAGWLPYGRTASGVRRSAYALCLAIRAAGLDHQLGLRVLLLAWFALPAAAVGTVLGAALGLRRLTGTLSLMSGIVGVGSAFALTLSPLQVDIGAGLAALAGLTAGAAALPLLVGGRSRHA